MSIISLVVSVASCLVTLLASHYSYHHLCEPIIHTVLSPKWCSRLNLYLTGTHSELILVTLKLFYAMSTFSGGKERKTVMDAFAWEAKVRMSGSLCERDPF